MENEKPKLWWISPANLIIGLIAGAIAVFGFVDSKLLGLKKTLILCRKLQSK